MTTVSVTNISPGLQSYKTIDNKNVVMRPGETRKIEMHPFHVSMLERAAAKENPAVHIGMSHEERTAHVDAVQAVKSANSKARRDGIVRPSATVLPTKLARTRVDTRFFTDPKVVDAPPVVTTAGKLVPPLTSEEASAVLAEGALQATKTKRVPKKKKAPARVVLKGDDE